MGGVIWLSESPAVRLVLRGCLLSAGGLFWFLHSDQPTSTCSACVSLAVSAGRSYDTLPFATPGPYRLVRHPLYGRLALRILDDAGDDVRATALLDRYDNLILLAIQFEERDLVREHGDTYEEYRRSVPMLVPFVGKRASGAGSGIVKVESDGFIGRKG